MTDIKRNISLATYTALDVGGSAEQFAELHSANSLNELPSELLTDCTVLGRGANVLVSDDGLPGLTVVLSGNPDKFVISDSGLVTADAAHNWDDLVTTSVEGGWYGLELTSGIPGGVGAAVVGNIAAYGQAVADSLVSIRTLDRRSGQHATLTNDDLELDYRSSNLQTKNSDLIVLSATFQLSKQPTVELTYQSALQAAQDLSLEPTNPTARRQIILEARSRAGSLFDGSAKTAGSFFRNPLVTPEQAGAIIRFDETGKTRTQIEKMNTVHGGDRLRVSAAHVLLAAGFKRGQSWGPVRLHPEHVLKIENTGGAMAQDIYDVAQEIIETTQDKLTVALTSEVKYIGNFK